MKFGYFVEAILKKVVCEVFVRVRFLCINPTGPERRANPTGHIIFVHVFGISAGPSAESTPFFLEFVIRSFIRYFAQTMR